MFEEKLIGGYCVTITLQSFRSTRTFVKWGIFNNYPLLAIDTEANSCFSIY